MEDFLNFRMQRGVCFSFLHSLGMLTALLLAGCNTAPLAVSHPQASSNSEVASRNAQRFNLQAIFTAYYEAWNVPTNVPPSAKVVTARITIAKDGGVLASHIIESSGNLDIDRSVQNALDKVRRVRGLKLSSPDQSEQIAVTIGFKAENETESLNWPPKSSGSAAGK